MSDVNVAKGGTVGAHYDRPRIFATSITLTGPLLAADVYQAINVPAGTRVLHVVADVKSADTGAGTRTFNVGDGTTGGGFLSTVNAKSVAKSTSSLALTEGTPNTITGYSGGKTYAAADTIDFTPLQDLADVVVTLTAVMLDLNA